MNPNLEKKINIKETYAYINIDRSKNKFSLYAFVHFVAFLFAIYLSFRCNGQFVLSSFLVAAICPWIYIIYVLATKNGFCFDY